MIDRGPLFIIGMPRSGTKLLRDLLNRNPQIGIPIVESHFIPYMVRYFGELPPFDDEEQLAHFYEKFTQTTFFINMAQHGRVLAWQQFRQMADKTSWEAVIGFILRFYAPENRAENFIWGDKSPSYIDDMDLLSSLFPQAKFLHIIRDPRDYCLSVRKTWNRSIYRAAAIWRERVDAARTKGQQMGKNYLEVFYESLLTTPEVILPEICNFLGCEFTSGMLNLTKSAEYFGDAKGQTRIISHNREKFKAQLSPHQIKRIEEICYPTATALNYQSVYATQFDPLNRVTLKLLLLYDSWSLLKFHVLEKGLKQGIYYFYHLYRESR